MNLLSMAFLNFPYLAWREGEENLNSRSIGLYRREDQKEVFGRKTDIRTYPASLTKIMTVILALEKFSQNLDRLAPIPREIFKDLRSQGAKLAGFYPGERASIRDIIYGAFLPSGGEAALGLAHIVGGSEEAFVDLMNKKARDLGMDSTNFTNPVGLHHRDHYSTIGDLFKLVDYSLENKDFRRVFSSRRYWAKTLEFHQEGLEFHSSLFENPKAQDLLGGKTGFTSRAGQCLISLKAYEGQEYILITTGARAKNPREDKALDDALKIYSNLEAGGRF